MVVEFLHTAYERDRAVHALVDYLSSRPKNQSVTIVDRITYVLRKDGIKIDRTDVMRALRRLQEAGCGRLHIGRAGHKTRFEWTAPTKGLAPLAAAETKRPGDKLGTREISVNNIKLILPTALSGEEVGKLIQVAREISSSC